MNADGDYDQLLLQLVGTVAEHAIFVLDADGRVRTWSSGAIRLFGYSETEIVGSHISRFYPQGERDAGGADRALAIAAADGRFEHEGWRVRDDGSPFWASSTISTLRGNDGRLLGFGVIARDLTDRKRGEDALRENEERFRLLVSSVADYAIFLLDANGTVSSWNLGAERLKGYRADEIIGHHISRFYTDQDRRAGVPERGLREAFEHGRWEVEGWRVRRDGSRFWANVVITSLRAADGSHRGFAKVTRDLTDRKRNEDALRGVLEREREAAVRLHEIDRVRSNLVAMIAHDLRAPVGVVQSYLQMVLADWATSSDTERIRLIERAAARADEVGELVDDIFDLARIEAGQLSLETTPTDISALASEVAADAAASSRRTITTSISAAPLARADPQRARQVLVNLVSNALKFSPADSTVHIGVDATDDEVQVSVRDCGPGIDPGAQERIFERFTRLPAHERINGAGLGLFIARSLAEAQGGSISVESEQGSGSTFRFALPIAVMG